MDYQVYTIAMHFIVISYVISNTCLLFQVQLLPSVCCRCKCRSACKCNNHDVDSTQAFEICIYNTRYGIWREAGTDFSHTHSDNSSRVDSRGQRWQTSEEQVVEDRLGGHQSERGTDIESDCEERSAQLQHHSR